MAKTKDYRVDLVKLAMELFLLTDAEKIAVYYMLKPDGEATLARRKTGVRSLGQPTTPTTSTTSTTSTTPTTPTTS